MKPGINQHPAYLWGQLIRERRLSKKITLREMSEHLEISSSKYSEIEHGILKWLTPKIELSLFLNLRNSNHILQDHNYLRDNLKLAKKAKPKLNCLGDIFKHTEMLPLWPPKKKDGTRMTTKEIEDMVDMILAPLKEDEN